jgi:hypothetical protein
MSRVSQLYYGIETSQVFMEGVHKMEDKYWSESEGKSMAMNQIQWFVNKVRKI